MVKFFQKAFSLAEMLIVLVIISIVVVFTLTLIKPDDSASVSYTHLTLPTT